MNYLAHAFLSFNDEALLTGNMISDFVKGSKKLDYPAAVQKGIALHRAIDQFTDAHPATGRAKEYFRKDYRLYAGPFIDIVFDHFLALDEEQFAQTSGLETFAASTYQQLSRNSAHFPEAFQKMFPYMQSQNWLYGYRFREGIRRSFGGLVRRAAYLDESDIAFDIFNSNYQRLAEIYSEFFPQLKAYALDTARKLQAG